MPFRLSINGCHIRDIETPEAARAGLLWHLNRDFASADEKRRAETVPASELAAEPLLVFVPGGGVLILEPITQEEYRPDPV